VDGVAWRNPPLELARRFGLLQIQQNRVETYDGGPDSTGSPVVPQRE
jgi:hypothetical protein